MFGRYSIDKSSDIPIYIQIANAISASISEGILRQDEKLPSQRKLTEIFAVSRNTIVAALDKLAADGSINVKPQSGAHVCCKGISYEKKSKGPDWENYFKHGMHRYGAIQRVEQLTAMGRSSDRVINISAAGLGREFNLLEPVVNLLEKKVFKKDIANLSHFNKYGYPPLCRIISERMLSHGIKATEKQVLIVPSVLQGINLNCIAFLHFASNFIYSKPSVINMDSIVHYTGSNLVGISMDDEGTMPEKLDKALKEKNGFFYVNPTSQNPTGKTMSLKRRLEVIEVANRRRVPILEVDSLRDIDVDGLFPPPLRALDKTDSVIYHGSILRTLNFNMGISWIIAAEEVVERLSDVKAQSDIYPSIILQLIAEELLRDGHYDNYLKSIRPIIQRKHRETMILLEKYFGDIATWNEKECVFYVWLKFDGRINTRKLFETVRNVAFYPGFFFDKSDVSHISICPASVTFEELDDALFLLNEAIRKLFHL